MKRKLITLFVLFALLLAGLPVRPARAVGVTIYVVAGNHCLTPCGNSWVNAHPNLQDALAAAVSGATIWVAEGVYYPGAAGDRTVTFTLKNGVAVSGGFNGTETRLSERDIAANPTILSGDIDKNDVNIDGNFIAETTADLVGDNVYHVVKGVNGTDNTAILDGFIITAGKADSATSPDDDGGGMFNSYSHPILTNLTFSGNYAVQEGGGLKNAYGNPVMTNLNFNGNHADRDGGGMYDLGAGPTLESVTFSNNSAGNYGGGMYIYYSDPTLTNVTFSGNQVTTYDGGGLYNNGGIPHLTNVIFENNDASYHGGGMYNKTTGIPILEGVVFTGNTAAHGGGLYNYFGNSNVTNTLFIGNDAGVGGGMYSYSSSPTVTNSTFSGNTAGTGGGIYNANQSAPTLQYVTISNNTATSFGGMYNSTDSHPILHGTLIANHSNGDCVNESGGALDASSSYNLIEDSLNACGLADGVDGNIIGQDPLLDPLADNGGDTLTHALLAASPAIDTGDTSTCPATDQRGVARPVGLSCDIGAFEEGEAHPYIVSITRADASPTSADSINFNVTFSEPVDNVHDYDFHVATTGTISGAIVTGITGDNTNGTVTVSTGTGSGTIRLDVLDGVGIVDMGGQPLSGLPFTSGETYTVTESVTFRSVDTNDGHILESTETSGVGGTLDSTATTFNLGDGAADKQYRSILSFNTATLPDTAVITMVTLKIRKQGLVGTNPFTILGGLKVDMRKPYFGTTVGLLVSDFQAAAGRIGVATFGATPVNNWYSAVLTAVGRNYLNKTGTTQFRLYFAVDDNNDNGADYMKFFSGNYATVSARPTLIIEYYIP